MPIYFFNQHIFLDSSRPILMQILTQAEQGQQFRFQVFYDNSKFLTLSTLIISKFFMILSYIFTIILLYDSS